MRRAIGWVVVLVMVSFVPLHARECIAQGPRVALTFDDGPIPARTPGILDALARHGARATFFMVGQRVATHPQLAWDVWAQGHELAVHTWSHRDLARSSATTRQSEISRGHDAIHRAVPEAHLAWWRAPYGSAPHLGVGVAREYGMAHRLWDVDTLDWQGAPAEVLMNRILSRVGNGDVVLMHDHGRNTLAMLDPLLVELAARGYQMVQVSELNLPVCGPPAVVEIVIESVPPAPEALPQDLPPLVPTEAPPVIMFPNE